MRSSVGRDGVSRDLVGSIEVLSIRNVTPSSSVMPWTALGTGLSGRDVRRIIVAVWDA
jgi:hypothetical protein